MGQSKRQRRKRAIEAKTSRPMKGRRFSFAAPVEIVAQAPGTEAGPQKFKMSLYTGEPLNLCSFEHPVVIDLGSIDLSAQRIPSLLDHADFADCVVGQVERLTTANGLPPLIAEGIFCATDDPRDAARFVLAKAKAGFTWQASIGADAAKYEAVEAGQSIAVNGRTYTGPLFVARGSVPREASFVVLGADRHTSAVLARRVKGSAMTFEQFVQGMGFDPAKLDETQTANFKALFAEKYPEGGDTTTVAEGETEEEVTPEEEVAAEGETEEEEPPPPTNARGKKPAVQGKKKPSPEEEDNRRVVANRLRQQKIFALCEQAGNPRIEVTASGRKQSVDLAAHAVEQGWTVQRTELQVLRASRGTGPATIVRGHDKDCTLQAMQGAMILRAGGKLDSKAYKTPGGRALLGKVAPWLLNDINDASRNRFMEAAHHYAQMSMIDVARESIRLSGRDAPHDRDDMIRAAFSGGGNLTNIFTTNVNAVLLTSYMEAGDSTAGWVKEEDVPDYKTNERPRVLIGDGLKALPRNQEAAHTSFSDIVESYKVKKYARQFEIDEQDMIDDNFGIFNETPAAFGAAAARLRPDLVYGAIILANPTLSATGVALFSDTNDNLQGSSALTAPTLSSGLAMMRLFRENSQNLNFLATHLIVPPTLEDLAVELTASPNITIARGGTTDTTLIRGNVNALNRRGLEIVAEARLENGVTNPADDSAQSGSASTWYLACADAHTIIVGYLAGSGRAPKVRATPLDKGRWGMNWDVELSIGVKALDWKGFVKSTS